MEPNVDAAFVSVTAVVVDADTVGAVTVVTVAVVAAVADKSDAVPRAVITIVLPSASVCVMVTNVGDVEAPSGNKGATQNA